MWKIQICCIVVLFEIGFATDADEKFKQMQQQIDSLSRQLMLQQFYTQQRVRTEGNSGLKQIRVTTTGLKNYHSQSHTGN